jgi:serine/threonine-protein kinase
VTYVGWVAGGGASVAVIVTGDQATAYVCDGATAEAWLHGTASGGYLRLAGDGGELTARYDRDRAAGRTSLAGRSWSFTIERVDPPEGLYRFADTIAGGAEVAGGWIVLPDGSQVGVLTVGGARQPAPALDPATGKVTVAGSAVTAERQG